jgi:hypothetical protein
MGRCSELREPLLPVLLLLLLPLLAGLLLLLLLLLLLSLLGEVLPAVLLVAAAAAFSACNLLSPTLPALLPPFVEGVEAAAVPTTESASTLSQDAGALVTSIWLTVIMQNPPGWGGQLVPAAVTVLPPVPI